MVVKCPQAKFSWSLPHKELVQDPITSHPIYWQQCRNVHRLIKLLGKQLNHDMPNLLTLDFISTNLNDCNLLPFSNILNNTVYSCCCFTSLPLLLLPVCHGCQILLMVLQNWQALYQAAAQCGQNSTRCHHCL